MATTAAPYGAILKRANEHPNFTIIISLQKQSIVVWLYTWWLLQLQYHYIQCWGNSIWILHKLNIPIVS